MLFLTANRLYKEKIGKSFYEGLSSRNLVVKVLFFCVDIWELFYLTRDLSQAQKKITAGTSRATDKMTTIFTQNDNFDDFE